MVADRIIKVLNNLQLFKERIVTSCGNKYRQLREMIANYKNSNQTLEIYVENDVCNKKHAAIYTETDLDSRGWVPVLPFPIVSLKKVRDTDQEDLTYSTIGENTNTYDETNNVGDTRLATAGNSAIKDNNVVNNYGDCDLQKYDVTGNLTQNQNMSLATYDHIKTEDKTDEYLWHILIPESEDTALSFQFEDNGYI